VQTIATEHALSEALAAAGQREKALAWARQAADVARKNDTPLPPRLKPATLTWVGDAFHDSSDAASACTFWREAVLLEHNAERLDSLRTRVVGCQ